MNLFYRHYGQGKNLIILHGLYGMSDNWFSIAKQLSVNFHVWLPDLRNHGHSPHTDTHTYNEMAKDIYYFITQHQINEPVLIGHSMGGKVVLKMIELFPEVIKKAIILDIAPINYSQFSKHEINSHTHIIESLLQLDINNLQKRDDADLLLQDKIKEPKLRSFLLKNLRRNEKNNFEWMLNLPVLKNNLTHIIDGFENYNVNTSTLTSIFFIKGELSNYIRKEFLPVIHQFFPQSQIFSIPHSGHWIHHDNPVHFIRLLKELL
ncbi:MAG: alpha/beta fold hydrolase [Bacteroidales bacterium]|nr:alpha/beta fold hydrolase [Bacteroidales bacterium]